MSAIVELVVAFSIAMLIGVGLLTIIGACLVAADHRRA